MTNKKLTPEQEALAKIGIISEIDKAMKQANAAKPLKINMDFKAAMKRVAKAKKR